MEFYRAAADPDGFAVNQGIGYFAVSPGDDAAEGGPGDIHPFRRFFLFEILEIRQAYGLQFVVSQIDLFQLTQRHSYGFEEVKFNLVADPAAFFRPGHLDLHLEQDFM
jgi:hypothetical protein